MTNTTNSGFSFASGATREAKQRQDPAARASVERDWNSQQQAIHERIANADNNIAVIARAGTGKTATLVGGLLHTPPSVKVGYTCFGKDPQKELATKTAGFSNAKAVTFHSMGNSAVRSRFGGHLKLDRWRMSSISKELFSASWDYHRALCKLVSWGKNSLLNDPKQLAAVADALDLSEAPTADELEDEKLKPWAADIMGERAHAIMEVAKDVDHTIDYDDMIWLPHVHELWPTRHQYLFVDEAQDINSAQLSLVSKAFKERLFFAGDPRQGIFGWRGAGRSVIDHFVKRFGAEPLPLSITYRCPRKVVELVKPLVPDYEAAPGAPEGILENVTGHRMYKEVQPGDYVLSRTNAPLMGVLLTLLKQGIPAAPARDPDFSSRLIKLIDKSKEKTTAGLLEWTKGYRQRQETRYGISDPDRFARVHDTVQALQILAQGESSASNLLLKIDKLLNNSTMAGKVLCSTVHKAKGSERNRVWMLADTFKRGQYEEDNIWYVACTRAREALYMVKGIK